MENYRYEFIAPDEMMDIHLEFFIDPGSVVNKHYHDWIEFIYLLNGDLEIQVNNHKRVLKKNEFVVINPMTIHSTRCKNGNTAILLQIPISFLEKFVPDIRSYFFEVNLDSGEPKIQTKISNIRSTLQDLWIAYQFQPEGYQFRCYSLIFELIYILIHSFSKKVGRKELRKNQKNLERVLTIIDYVKIHYKESVGIAEIAGVVGLNEIYFSRFFKANMGITFLEYLNMVRLEKIHIDILNSNECIKDIQERHGFCNDKVFRRMFREVYGCSPREARKNNSTPERCSRKS